MKTFLTRSEIYELTGYKKPALQRHWLQESGYQFDVRKDGRPAVYRTVFEAQNRLLFTQRSSIMASRCAEVQRAERGF
jgi:hypothetical protein